MLDNNLSNFTNDVSCPLPSVEIVVMPRATSTSPYFAASVGLIFPSTGGIYVCFVFR